jgi:leader peptidase (prepilin peptidase)/N-methyltransferase
MSEQFPFWTVFFPLFVFAYGAAVGSFLNVCIWRFPREESVVTPPSHCPHCDHRLAPKDLIPLLSQLWLRGRCRYCKTAISWRYFGVELLTGAAFLLLYLPHIRQFEQASNLSQLFGPLFLLAMNCLFVSTLVFIFFVDLDTSFIPDVAVVVGVLVGIAKDVYGMWQSGWSTLWQPVPFTDWAVPIPQSILGALIGAGTLWLLGMIGSLAAGKEAMGLGDVFLLGAMGANLSLPQLLLAFMVAVFVGGVVAGALLFFRIRGRKDPVPFGPMLVVGTFTALVFGDVLIRGYLRAFGLDAM